MTEVEWVKLFAPAVEDRLRVVDPRLSVLTGKKLPYANEIVSYKNAEINDSDFMDYETDLLVSESSEEGIWKPRVIVEAKYRGSITTHDAITYSHKAFTHRQVHPYLRYGILIGEREHHPLPGRLFRHGTQFDFMLSWVATEPTWIEMDAFVEVLTKEVAASRIMEEIIFDSRKKGRNHYTVLHKELRVK
jgi:hypothetical protein